MLLDRMMREFYCMILVRFITVCSTSLPSEFYQPTSGVYFERWTSTTYYSMTNLNSIPNYPDCPKVISHSDTFSYSDVYPGFNQYGRFRASFVSTQTGIHKFFAILNNVAQVYIELNPTGMQKILDISYSTNDDWNEKKWCNDVDLMKGFRYEIIVYYYGDGQNADFFKLGVKFPDSTEVKPINSTFLRRSMEYYKWNGLLAHKYNSFKFFGGQSDYTLATAYSMNPSYPSNPASYLCKATLYEIRQRQFDYYALKFIGYMSVPETNSYKFKMFCNEMCQINMTISGSYRVLGHYNDAWQRSSREPKIYYTEMDAGTLSEDVMYPFTVFFCESFGYDYIQVSHRKGSSSYSESWAGKLRNLVPNDTAKSLPLPIPEMVNSTAISVTLPSMPYLPPKNNWTYVQTSEILYHRRGVVETPQRLAVIGVLPQTIIATGLQKYTDYLFYAHYHGKISRQDQNIITRYSAVMKTDEDVPDSPPPSLVLDTRSPTSIRAKWGTFSSLSLWNGIGIGYEVHYRLKNAGSGSWTSVLISGPGNRQYTANGLLKYRMYEFRVAGRTSKGSGRFSEIKEERTKEDVPSAGPSNITALNSSSSSIVVTWDDVPPEHQNGIITEYRVYIRKNGSSGGWSGEDTSKKQWSKSGLDLWACYDIKIAAKTSVGEGTKSTAVSVRTDEDIPGAAPTNIAAFPLSSSSLNVTWSEIVAEKRYGIIVSYKLKYKRADGNGILKEAVVTEKSCAIGNLAQSIAYEIAVAGMTIKGVGVFSSKLLVSTGEDAPSAPPQNLRGNFTNATAIRLHWDLVVQQDRNGIIMKYTVQYRIKGSQLAWQEIVVGSDSLTLHILKLEYYTLYEFKIAAETAIGRGPFSSLVFIRTDAYAPSKPPMNLTGHFLDQQSINITWTRVPKEHRQGIIEGYKLYYADKTLPEISWQIIIIPNRHGGGDMFNQSVKGLKIYTPYLFKISAFTYKAVGALSDNVTVWTDEYKPTEPPKNISGVNASSTEIILRWLDMKEIDGEANGEVLGYSVRYRVVDCYEDRPKGCDENEVFNITTYGRSPEIKIPNLRKYTIYSLQVQVFNSKGRGSYSTSINITTDEDIPDEPPTRIESWPSKSDSIKIYWSPIPESHRNGIILGYRIFYKPIDEPQRRYDRAPRSLNQFAVYGALPGEKMVEVNSSANSVEIKDLKDYSWYKVRVGALTSKGLGATFAINGTTAQRSPIEAPLLKVIDMIGFEEIALKWTEISKAGARGEVLGYQIQYWLSELHENPVIESTKHSFEILEPNRTAMVTGLQAFAQYRIRILAFNEGGFGIWSQEYGGGTCSCSKYLSSVKIILPPLVNHENLDILPAMLSQAITSCCGNCSGKHGTTKVNWEKDSRNFSSVKYSRQEALNAIAAGTNLALPIFRDSFEIEGDVDSSEYVIVPLIESKYVAIFKRNPTEKELGNAASVIITSSLWGQYPIFVISTVMTLLAGIIFWIIESGKNVVEFSRSFVRGIGSGLWLAYITMTTVGYGDITPVTKLGKIFTMIWMLIGLVLTSMIVGALSSAFNLEFVLQPSQVKESDKVLASQELLMIAAGLKAGRVTLGNTSDGKFVQSSLLSGNVSAVVLDTYTAGTLKDYLVHPQIFMEETKMVTASYSVALGGETKRIRKCIRRFASENAKSILEKVDQLTFLYQRGRAKPTELFNYIGSSHSDFMENTTLYCGILLAVLFGFGVIYEIARHIRGRGKVETDSMLTMRLPVDILEGIIDLERSISEKIDKIEVCHAQERMKLKKMKIGQLSTLLYMYPALTKFDPDLAKLKGEEEEPDEYYRANNISHGQYYSSDEEESDFDRPMDLKVGK